MDNETSIFIYQTENGNTKVDVRLENKTVWMTQKAIAELYQTTSQNITLHVKNIMKYMDEKVCTKYFNVIKKEGSRRVKRNIIHYHIDIIFNIALRGKYLEEFTKLIYFIKEKEIPVKSMKFIPVRERNFRDMLKSSFEGIVEIFPQYRIGRYIVDFYMPEVKLVVEYDEEHHKKQLKEDQKRQNFIEKSLNAHFIRVNEGEELQGLNRIIKYLFSNENMILEAELEKGEA